MTANASLERLFFNYIITKKPFYFNIVEPYFFTNTDIQFVYTVCRDEYQATKNADLKPKKIVELVRIQDKDKKISNDLLKALLTVDMKQYGDDEDWINKRIEAWRISNSMKSRVMESIEYIRNLDTLSYDKVMEISNKIKSIINDASTVSMADEDLGSDFDDADNHTQDSYGEKVTTGYKTLDSILNGGLDKKTLSIILGMTSSGKSLFLQNMAVNAANAGINVVYISLEMSEKKCLKRLGAMRLKIPINDYDNLSKDPAYIQGRIEKLKQGGSMSNDLYDNQMGKIFVKEFAANTCSDDDIANYCRSLEEKKGLKIGLIIIDYITIMAAPKGMNIEGNLYLRGKYLAEGIRGLGYKFDCPVLTAIQVGKDAWGANDMGLGAVSESKAIAETADNMFGIIRNEEMKRKNLYRLKMLKLRDGDFTYEQIMLDLNVKYLSIENDKYLEPNTQ